jgi:hypothetical protein
MRREWKRLAGFRWTSDSSAASETVALVYTVRVPGEFQ